MPLWHPRLSSSRRASISLALLTLLLVAFVVHSISTHTTFKAISTALASLPVKQTLHYDPSPLPHSGDAGALTHSAFNFTDKPPRWLTPLKHSTTSRPLIIRLGIISQPSDFDRRKAFREYILQDVLSDEVVVHHRFFVGRKNKAEDQMVREENRLYQDIHLLNMDEATFRMGMKRWFMLKWAAEEPASTYDYYLSADTDAFLRLSALARRVRYLHPELKNPREQSILWGQMGVHKVHFVPTVSDDDPGDVEDAQLKDGDPRVFWYDYPYGFGFLMSSHLVDRLGKPDVVLPHHVRYPGDDVLVGNWVADWAPETVVIKDRAGFHDALGHNGNVEATSAVDYDTVCIHHLNVDEMRGIRYKAEFRKEWVTRSIVRRDV